MGVWDFIQDQVLGMKWLNELLGVGLSALALSMAAPPRPLPRRATQRERK